MQFEFPNSAGLTKAKVKAIEFPIRSPKDLNWEPVDHLQGSLAPGPKPRKSLKKVSRGLWPRDPPRVWKKSRKSLESLEKVSKRSRKTFSRLFPDSAGRLFSDFFGVSGPEGPRDPCKWSTGSQDLNWGRSPFLGRGCDEALFSEKKGFSVKRGEAFSE